MVIMTDLQQQDQTQQKCMLPKQKDRDSILARRSQPESESEDEPFRNAETLLKIWLLENKLNVIELEDVWALLRLRANGQIEPRDLEEFEVENVARVEHLPYYLGDDDGEHSNKGVKDFVHYK